MNIDGTTERLKECLEKIKTFESVRTKLINILGEPYFNSEKSLIFCVDTTKKLSLVDFSFIDLTITSPPYNIGKEYEQIKSVDNYINWSIAWIKSVFMNTNDNGGMLLNLGYISLDDIARAIPIPYLIWDKVPFYLNQEIVWNYTAGVACKNYLSPRNEKLLWYVKDPRDYNFNLDSIRDRNVKYPNSKKNGKLRTNTLGKNPSDVWEIAKVTTGKNRQSKERTPHPCQFPEDLADRAVLGFSNVGDIVFDPFMGSGTTLISCHRNDRFCVGFEIKEDYCKIIRERILNYSEQ